ncbi:MAG: lipoate--protein ligase family protein [Nanobdellota archaeon]
MRWRIIKDIETEGAMQMAVDEAIMTARIKGIVPDTLRFFTWKPPCLTVGFFQSLEKEVNLGEAKEQGVDVVRRYTGGGAVLHDKELTYSLAVSEKDVPSDIIESYKFICDALIKGFRRLGINGEFTGINDIVSDGKKISGNAQTRKQGVVLQHGTILLDVDVERMFSLLKVSDEKTRDKMIDKVKERVTSLKQELGKEADIEDVKASLLKGFDDTFDINFEEEELTDYERKLAESLYREKYSTEEWNRSR